jgi:hypothetical protein
MVYARLNENDVLSRALPALTVLDEITVPFDYDIEFVLFMRPLRVLPFGA